MGGLQGSGDAEGKIDREVLRARPQRTAGGQHRDPEWKRCVPQEPALLQGGGEETFSIWEHSENE